MPHVETKGWGGRVVDVGGVKRLLKLGELRPFRTGIACGSRNSSQSRRQQQQHHPTRQFMNARLWE